MDKNNEMYQKKLRVVLGNIMAYIGQKLLDISGKNYGIYWVTSMGYILGYMGQKLWHKLGKTFGYIGQKLWDLLGNGI